VRAVIKPANASLSEDQMIDLVAITSQRLNVYGLSDITVRSAKDFSGETFMIVEIAGATPSDIKNLLGSQGKFEAKVGNTTVFEGGNRDISDVCRNDATCAGIRECLPSQDGYFCNFQFAVYLKEDAAQRHADVTRNLALDETGQYLNESLYLFVDDKEVDKLLIGSSLRGQATTQISIQGSGTGATREEAIKNTKANMNRLQTILLTGSLPYKLEIVKLDTISPFLGKEFTKSIIYLGLVVFLIISVALFIKYRKIKVTLAVILTMFSEAFITLGIAALIKWNLDAPSIAGIIAGMGTGVNDQIVIIDESLSGETGNETLKEKVKRAFFIIVGAFLTIIAAMIPLFWAGAGLLRGFALTTIIGVTVGILVTRPAFADIIKKISS
jgi:preprotein translocase subunit SecD